MTKPKRMKETANQRPNHTVKMRKIELRSLTPEQRKALDTYQEAREAFEGALQIDAPEGYTVQFSMHTKQGLKVGMKRTRYRRVVAIKLSDVLKGDKS